MSGIVNKELIEKAASVVNARKNGENTVGDVGCALLTEKGNMYTGVCIDATSGMGFCAEHNAIGAMTTAGESKIKKIVAVWKDKGDGDIYVVSPCGRCREFIARIDASNLETEVILAENKSATLKELLPYYDSYTKV